MVKLYCQMTVPKKYRHYFKKWKITRRISDKCTVIEPPSCIAVYPNGNVTVMFGFCSVTQ
jgi:hypothetical protein